MTTATAHAKRTSARIEARQQGLTLPQWKVPQGNNEEKRLMQGMLKHLQETDEIDNAGLYRYLFREADTLANQLHLVPVLRKVRARLAEFDVPYMKYDEAEQHWKYWNDFTLTGLTVWNNSLPTDEIDRTRDIEDDDEDESLEDTAEERSFGEARNKAPPQRQQYVQGTPNKKKPATLKDNTQEGRMFHVGQQEPQNVEAPQQEDSQETTSPSLIPGRLTQGDSNPPLSLHTRRVE